MNSIYKTIIDKAEQDSWKKMNSYTSVIEAVQVNRISFLKQRLIQLTVVECINICQQNGDEKSIEELKKLFDI